MFLFLAVRTIIHASRMIVFANDNRDCREFCGAAFFILLQRDNATGGPYFHKVEWQGKLACEIILINGS